MGEVYVNMMHQNLHGRGVVMFDALHHEYKACPLRLLGSVHTPTYTSSSAFLLVVCEAAYAGH